MSKIIVHNRSHLSDGMALDLVIESLKTPCEDDAIGYIGARIFTLQRYAPNPSKEEYIVSRFNQAKSVRYVISDLKERGNDE